MVKKRKRNLRENLPDRAIENTKRGVSVRAHSLPKPAPEPDLDPAGEEIYFDPGDEAGSVSVGYTASVDPITGELRLRSLMDIRADDPSLEQSIRAALIGQQGQSAFSRIRQSMSGMRPLLSISTPNIDAPDFVANHFNVSARARARQSLFDIQADTYHQMLEAMADSVDRVPEPLEAPSETATRLSNSRTEFQNRLHRRLQELSDGVTQMSLSVETLPIDYMSGRQARVRSGQSSLEVTFDMRENTVHDLPRCATAMIATRLLDSFGDIVNSILGHYSAPRFLGADIIIICGESYLFVVVRGDQYEEMHCFDAHGNPVRRFRADNSREQRFGSKASMLLALSRLEAFR